MINRVTRRTALGVPLAALPALARKQGGPGGGPAGGPASTGFFTVPEHGAHIALLLPAVQKVREPARMQLTARARCSPPSR